MSFLGYEKPVEYTGYQIFDPTMAKMILDAQDKYFNAVYADYQQGLEDMKEFKKEYYDFDTPILADQDWYNRNVTGKVRNFINDAYAKGIDLTRSAEGRAAIAQLINSVDVGKVAKLRSSAENAKEYLKNRGLLEASGKYNDDLERRFLGFDVNNWDTLGNGIWSRTSPTEMKTLKELTNDWYNNRTARDLSPEEVGPGYDRRYDYQGFLDSDLLNIARNNTPGWNNSVYSQYYRDLAEQKVAARGGEYTQADVEQQLQRDIADAQQEWLISPTKSANEFAKMAQQHAYSVDLENKKYEHDKEIAEIKAGGKNNGPDGGYSSTMNMVVDSEGAMRNLLTNYTSHTSMQKYNYHAAEVQERAMDLAMHPEKYTKDQAEKIAKEYSNLDLEKESLGFEGVAKEIVNLASKRDKNKRGPIGSLVFGNNARPYVNSINNILRDLSNSAASTSTLNAILREVGGGSPAEDGGTIVDRSRLCGVGEVMADVLRRGNYDGKKHKDVDAAIEALTTGSLKEYGKSYTASNWDLRNSTDDWMQPSEFWPTGRVLSGDKYYYIEVADDKEDRDECCWFKVERDTAKGGGFHPTLSSITQRIDNSYMHEFSNSNVIGNQQGSVLKYND